ncbi:MAG: DUF6042 family protein [Micromonosporaceae bacterium]
MTFTPEWHHAEMHPAWARWLPCSVHWLRIVPHPDRFPRTAWDEIPEIEWDAPAWCDPGDPDDWVANSLKRRDTSDPDDADHVAEHAREHYEQAVTLRAERIEQFNQMCVRAAAAPPATVDRLLECLITLGGYERHELEGEEWLAPRLWRNPIDVLAFTAEEAGAEAANQHHERALLVAAGLRRLILAEHAPDPEAEWIEVPVTTHGIAEHARVTAGTVPGALELLAGQEMVDPGGLDLNTLRPDTPVTLRVPWAQFEPFFDFEELPAPEHFR